MATQLFLRDSQGTGISDYRDLLASAGSSLQSGSATSTAGGTQIQFQKSGVNLTFVTGRSPSGGWTLSGNVEFSIWGYQSSDDLNGGFRVRMFHRTTGGTETEITGSPFNDGDELSTSIHTNMMWTGTPSSTAFLEDERLVIRLYLTNVGTMGDGFTATATYNQADGLPGASYIQLTQTVTFKPETITHQASVNDTMGMSHTVTAQSTLFAGVNDTVGMSHTVTAGLLLEASVSDTVGMSHVVNAGLLLEAGVADTIGMSHTVNAGLLLEASVSDTIQFEATVNATVSITTTAVMPTERRATVLPSAADLRGYIAKFRNADDPDLAAVLELVQRYMTLTDDRLRMLAGRIPDGGQSLSIDGQAMVDRSIDGLKLKRLSIGTAEIDNASITDAKIVSLTANKLTAGTIDAAIISVINLSASSITSGTIDASLIAVTNLNASNINTGTLNASVVAVTNLNASNITTGTLNVARLAAASIDVTKITLRTLISTPVFTGNATTTIFWTSGFIYLNGAAQAIGSGSTTDPFVYWDEGTGNFLTNTVYFPLNTRYLIATNVSGVPNEVWRQTGGARSVTSDAIHTGAVTETKLANLAVTDAKIFSLDAAKISAGFLSVNRIAAGSITANKLNLRAFITDTIWANNSPSAGLISWTSPIVYYQGTSYSLSSNNTANELVWWNVGDSFYSSGSAASYVPAPTRYLVAINDGGTAIEVWQNVTGGRTITEDNFLGFSVVTGIAIQPYAQQTGIIIGSTGATSDVTILNVSGSSGLLMRIWVRVSVTVTGATPPDVDIEIQVDGATAQLLSVYESSLQWGAFYSMVDRYSGSAVAPGQNSSDVGGFGVNFGFTDSISVKIKRNVLSSGNGTIEVGCLYGLRVA